LECTNEQTFLWREELSISGEAVVSKEKHVHAVLQDIAKNEKITRLHLDYYHYLSPLGD
jgi:hypothetical protein